MPIYRGRTKGTHRIITWVRGVRAEEVFAGTKTEAKEREARILLERQAELPVDAKRILAFSDFCVSHYRPHAERHLKASTWKLVRVYQVDTLCKRLGHIKLTELRRRDIESYQSERLEDGRKPSSINNELRVFRTIINYASELGFPVAKLKWKKLSERGHGRAKAWTLKELRAIFKATAERHAELVDMFVFLVNTGCRKGEALAAEWSWVDFRARLLRIPSNEVWQPKSNKPREVPLSNALLAVLKKPRRHETYIFPSRDGGRYATFPKDLFWDIVEAAKVDGTPHMFRHTFASHFLANRKTADLGLLAEVMGHSHTRVTELYSHMLPDHLKRARNAVNIAP